MKGYIYTLSSEYENDIFYVGSTFDPALRLRSHRTKFGYLTKMLVIEEVEVNQRWGLQNLEKYWIDQLRQWGFILKNKDSFRTYNNAPPDIVKYILDIQKNKYPMSEMTMEFFKEIMWSLIREHKTLSQKHFTFTP